MSGATSVRAAAPALEPRLATTLVGGLGGGVVLAFSGAAAGRLELTAVGGAIAGTCLVLLLAAGLLDPLLVLVLALPLPAIYSDEAVRLSPAVPVTAAVLFAWAIARGLDGRRLDTGPLPRRATLVLFSAVTLSGLFAASHAAAARELVNWALLLGLLVAATDLLRVRGGVRTLALALAAVAGVSGFLAPLQTVGILPGVFPLAASPFYRATLGFGWPNELAMFFALTLPFAVYAASTAPGRLARVLALAGAGGAVIGLVATFSRGSWLSVLAGSLALLLAGERRFVARVWIGAIAAGILLDLASGGVIHQRILSTFGDWVVEQRAALTVAGIVMFLAHPLLGVGPGGFADALEGYGPRISWLWDYLPTAQNAYVQMAAETGLAGLLALLAFLFATFLALRRSARRALIEAGARSEEAKLRLALLWSFATACALGFGEWTFAHGIGQLVMLVAAMGFAVDRAIGSSR